MKTTFLSIFTLAAGAALGCQSNQQTVRIDHGDQIPVAKSTDSTKSQAVTTAADTAGSGNATSLVSQTASNSSTSSPWSKLFGSKDGSTPQRVILPRDDQQADPSSGDATAANKAPDDF
jgi:hypothetical protein